MKILLLSEVDISILTMLNHVFLKQITVILLLMHLYAMEKNIQKIRVFLHPLLHLKTAAVFHLLFLPELSQKAMFLMLSITEILLLF